jgi:hypothetical protein
VAAGSKASTVFDRSNTGIVGSNPLEAWMSAFILCLCRPVCAGSGLATA